MGPPFDLDREWEGLNKQIWLGIRSLAYIKSYRLPETAGISIKHYHSLGSSKTPGRNTNAGAINALFTSSDSSFFFL